MTPVTRMAGGAAIALLGMAPARAQTLPDVERLQRAVVEAWVKTPLTQRNVLFETGKATVYGAYERRPSSVFKPGEPLLTYFEPVGYLWKTVGPDSYAFGVTGDFLIMAPDGKILGGKENFVRYEQKSHYRNQELMVNITLSLDGAPPGKYIVKYTIHDVNSDKVSSFEQPFEIAS